MMPFMVQRIVRLSLYVRTLDSMRPTKKKAYLDKKELKDNINRLAAEIKGGEEDVMEETEIDVKFPLDVKDSDVLLVTPSADFFA